MFHARTTGEFRRWLYLGPLLFETGFLVAYMTALSFQTDRTSSTPTPADAWPPKQAKARRTLNRGHPARGHKNR